MDEGAGTGGPVPDRQTDRWGSAPGTHSTAACWGGAGSVGQPRADCGQASFGGGRRGLFGKLQNMVSGFNCEVSIHGWIGIRRRKSHQNLNSRIMHYVYMV
jgi:hypothetical protein